jgi:hypothetical protein
MINRKIAMSGLSILTAFAMMGGSAFAAFTTTATATGNTFSTTTPGLTVNVNNTGAGTNVTGATVTGLIPGVDGPAQTFVLANTTNPASSLPVTLQLTNLPANTLPGADLTIRVNCAGSAGGLDITATYSDWITSAHSLGTITSGGSFTCTMTPTLNSGVGNGDAGKSAVFNADFTGSIGS